MKRLYILILFTCITSLSWACRPWRNPVKVQKSDGTWINVFMNGDEDFHWYTTEDGTIMTRNGKYYEPISISNEEFLLQGHRKAKRLQGIRKRLEPVNMDHYTFPHIGEPKALVILAEFQDCKFTVKDPVKTFNQYLNLEGHGNQQNFGCYEHLNLASVRQYFIDQSNGKFKPSFDIKGPITLPKDMAYYGKGKEKPKELVIDAIKEIEGQADKVDFTQYDYNDDGYVDVVYVIFAGYGQNTGGPEETMWSKSFNAKYTTYDNMKIGRCGINNELAGNEQAPKEKYISGIGVFCHEFSHCLGLPDFYTTGGPNYGKPVDNIGMEDWSLMDYGLYGRNGCCPTAYTAWEREAMGWIEPIETITTEQEYTLSNIDRKDGKAYKIKNTEDEYYVLQYFENKFWNQAIGKTKESSSIEGLLVYHVNYDAEAFSIRTNSVNNGEHPRMTVIPADGCLYSSYHASGSTMNKYKEQVRGDIFMQDFEVNEHSKLLPNQCWWASAETYPKFKVQVDSSEHKATICLQDTNITAGIADVTSNQEQKDGMIYNINGIPMGTSIESLPKGIYIRNHKKLIVN